MSAGSGLSNRSAAPRDRMDEAQDGGVERLAREGGRCGGAGMRRGHAAPAAIDWIADQRVPRMGPCAP